MKSLFTTILLCLFWIIWAPCALFKDAIQLLYVPFDTQRLVNTYIQTIRNSQQLRSIWKPAPPQQPQQQTGLRKIGFEGAPPIQPSKLSGPIC